jgi:hypothetical protein
MFQHAKITYRDRKTTAAFDGPVLEATPEDGAEVWHERVKLTMSHNKDKKRYEAYISWCKAAERNGFQVEQSAIFTDPFVEFATAPAARFSENNFESFCSQVIAMVEAVAATDDLATGAAADLIRKAKSYLLVKN